MYVLVLVAQAIMFISALVTPITMDMTDTSLAHTADVIGKDLSVKV